VAVYSPGLISLKYPILSQPQTVEAIAPGTGVLNDRTF
tara:strand:- start:507 stop:620 length:114 start_codon:yes stop_codon:yes gene_type:complete